jgi:hypothetical protein
MAKCMFRKATSKKTYPKARKGASIVDFVIEDDGSSVCTILGLDNAGQELDISGVATAAPPPVSADPTVITVDTPVGMTFGLHAVIGAPLTIPGSPVNVTAGATWNDGSIGPFTFVLPCDTKAGPAGGIIVVPGPVTVGP